MSDYTIVSPEADGLRIDPKEFIEQLCIRWPDAEVHMITDFEKQSSLWWKLQIGTPPLVGRLNHDLNTVGLDAYQKECAQFAVWYRKLVPSDYSLVIFNEGFDRYIELEGETTEQTIIDALTS